jgi:hypothetical protein
MTEYLVLYVTLICLVTSILGLTFTLLRLKRK